VNRPELRKAAADNWPPLVLAGIAFGGSFDHWTHLAASHGQHGVLAPAIAVCVDLGVYMATRERQRDARIGRGRRGWMSWPTLVLIGGILLTLAGNVSSALTGSVASAHTKLAASAASAHPTAWGIITSLIPGAFLLVAISLMERRAAEDGRKAAADERQRQAREAAERHRQAEIEAERERQETARLEAEAAARRQAERQAELAARRAAIVNGPSVGASVITDAGPSRLALVAGGQAPESGADATGPATSATAVMRAHWDREVAAGRVPSGADLLRAAGAPPTSSLGRQCAGKWRAELDDAEPEGARA
jgi:hypothetical protein